VTRTPVTPARITTVGATTTSVAPLQATPVTDVQATPVTDVMAPPTPLFVMPSSTMAGLRSP
jgi:hypothetical protein